MRIPETLTMRETLESVIEIQEITGNVWQAVADKELTAEEAREILDAILQ